MVKKAVFVINPKSIAAKARKSALEADRAEREAKQKEDDYWREAEGPKSRAAKKREAEAEKRAETMAKKAEARRLAEQEKKELEESVSKSVKKKVTEAELVLHKETGQADLRRIAEEERKRATRIANREEYERMVSVANVNRDDLIIEARTVEDALAHLTVTEALPVDRHSEKRRKALFKAFEEAELPGIKAEKPGLTHGQYKDLFWKLWKKCPENLDNMVRLGVKVKIGVASCSRLDDGRDKSLKIGLEDYAAEEIC